MKASAWLAWSTSSLLGVAALAPGQERKPFNPFDKAPPATRPVSPATQPAAPTPPSAGQTPPAGPVATTSGATPQVDTLLDQLDQRGQTLESFVADVSLVEEDSSVGLETTRIGKVWFQKLPEDAARMRVSFTDRINGNAKRTDLVDYVLDKGWLEERQHAKKLAIRRQVLRPGEKLNILKLGEGPFPLPIGQKKEEVRKQFEVSLAKVSKDDPKGSSHLLLRPREGTKLRRKFSAIDVWIDGSTHMPVKVQTTDDKQTLKTSTLSNVQLNPKLSDADFTLPKINPADWATQDEPFRD